MTRRSSEKFEVYEFREDDKLVELDNQKFRNQFRKRNTKTATKSSDDSPINKYNFLQSFASGDWGYKGEPIDVDVDVENEVAQEKMDKKNGSHALLDVDAIAIDRSCKVANIDLHLKTREFEDVPLEVETLNAQTESVGTLSSEPSSTEACSATLNFNDTGNQVLLEKQLTEPDYGGCEIDEENMTVKIFPSFIIHGDVPFQESRLTFTSSGVKLERLISNASRKILCSEWTIGDIMGIKSEWSSSVNNAMVYLYLRSEDSKGTGNTNSSSDIEQLKFSFYDPNWAKGENAIKTLDVRYKNLWNIDFDVGTLSCGKELLGQHMSMSSPAQSFSGSGQPLEDITYPKGDPDAIIISKRDIERLKPETFINDTIIDFYIKYLASNLQSKDKQRFHFFNSFFFRKLADLDKDPSSAYEGTIAFQRVHKWTRKVNLFEKDYIFIPVNYSLHWSLVVICHLGEVPTFKDEEYDNTSKVPCILHMDSIRGSHKGLKNLIRRYLCEEWKERHNGSASDVSSKFSTLRFVPLELPQQENFFDCGLFLLHYVERFLEEAPLNFSPFNITKYSSFLTKDWFPPQEASVKRYSIKKLIKKIRKDHSSENSPSADREGLSGTADQEADVILLEQICGSTKTCHGISPEINAEKLGVSLSKSGSDHFVSSELSGPLACSRFNSNVDNLQSPSHRINYMSPLKEVEEIEERVPESPLDMEDRELNDCVVRDSEDLDLDDCVVRDSEDEEEEKEDSVHDSDELRHFPFTRIENNLYAKKDWPSEEFIPKRKGISGSRDYVELESVEARRSKRNRNVRSEGRRCFLR